MATAGSLDLSKQIAALGVKMKRLTDDAKKEIAAALFVGGLKIEENAKLDIAQGKKTGKIYKRGNKSHQASAAGEAPASDTGRLLNSFQTGATSKGMVVQVKAGKGTVDYAVHLEYGTKDMAARPFMKPALKKSEPFIIDRMDKAVRKAIKNHVAK